MMMPPALTPEQIGELVTRLFEVPSPELMILGVRVCRSCAVLVPLGRLDEHASWHGLMVLGRS